MGRWPPSCARTRQPRAPTSLSPVASTPPRSRACAPRPPSRSSPRAHETFGLAAVEALAAGLPVVATGSGALAELEGDVTLVAAGDVAALATAARAVVEDPDAGAAALTAARRRAAPEVVAPRLAALYDAVAPSS